MTEQLWENAQKAYDESKSLVGFVLNFREHIADVSDDQLKEALQRNDPNGCYTDELRRADFGADAKPLSRLDAVVHFAFALSVDGSERPNWNWSVYGF